MKKKERKILERIYKCLQIPKFASISSSTTIHGLASYARDCAAVLPKIQEIIYSLGCGESWDGEIEDMLYEIEQWHKKRSSEDWG